MVAVLRGVGGELRKGASPSIAMIFVVAFGVVWASMGFATGFAQDQADVLPNIASMESSILDIDCLADLSDSSDTCVASRMQSEATINFRESANRLGEIGQALGTTPGAFRFGAHHWATSLGWIVVSLVAAFHVAGEWASGSVGLTALSVGSRRRMLVLKSLSTWLISLVGLLAVGGLLALTRSTFTTSGVISNAEQTGTVQLGVDEQWSSWESFFSSFAITAVVLLGVSILAVSIAASVRKPIPTVLIMSGLVVSMFLIGPTQFTPSETVARWLNFSDVNGGLIGDHILWSYTGSKLSLTDTTIDLDPSLASTVILLVLVGALGGVAVAGLNRRKAL